MIYVMSDIHGQYDQYAEMLSKIGFSGKDTLYVLGDVIDRGKDGIKILFDMMNRFNVVPMLGNHEYMAYKVLSKLNVEITEDNYDSHLDYKTLISWQDWLSNGGVATQEAFTALHHSGRRKILEYLCEFTVYEELTVGDTDYILAHAGLGNFSAERPLYDYAIEEFVWDRADYSRKYFDNKILITGHTPTFMIDEACRGKIIRKNNHIAIDCGVVYGEKLGCICLDTQEEFYV